jgi:hypothetical protein
MDDRLAAQPKGPADCSTDASLEQLVTTIISDMSAESVATVDLTDAEFLRSRLNHVTMLEASGLPSSDACPSISVSGIVPSPEVLCACDELIDGAAKIGHPVSLRFPPCSYGPLTLSTQPLGHAGGIEFIEASGES